MAWVQALSRDLTSSWSRRLRLTQPRTQVSADKTLGTRLPRALHVRLHFHLAINSNIIFNEDTNFTRE